MENYIYLLEIHFKDNKIKYHYLRSESKNKYYLKRLAKEEVKKIFNSFDFVAVRKKENEKPFFMFK